MTPSAATLEEQKVTATTEEPGVINALPDKSTLSLTPRQRGLGRLARIQLPREPGGVAEKDLAGDLFHSMFQVEPVDRPDVPEERQVNRALMDWMKETHGWEESRASTAGNLAASMMASSLMWAHLTNDETMAEALKKQEEAEAAANEARAQQAAANAMMQAAAQMEQAGDAGGAGKLRAQAQQAQAHAAAAQQNAADAAAQAAAMMGEAREKPLKNAKMAAAAKATAQQAKEVAEAAAGWGMGSGSLVNTDPKAALEFLKHNTGKIARIARLAGRMRGFALQARKERAPRGIIPTRVGLTQDMHHVFTSELAMLRPDAPPAMRAQKIAQFVDSGLLGYVPTGEAEKDGPFVAAVDVSPSMRWPDAREIVAKAVALGVAQAAKMDGREYILFAFGSDPRLITVVKSDMGWGEHLKWAQASQNGGTDFDLAIGKAIELLGDLCRADCLFISDGEAGVAGETVQMWRAFQEATGARMFYVPVGRGGYIDIEDLADQVYHLADLDEETGAGLAAQLGRWI